MKLISVSIATWEVVICWSFILLKKPLGTNMTYYHHDKNTMRNRILSSLAQITDKSAPWPLYQTLRQCLDGCWPGCMEAVCRGLGGSASRGDLPSQTAAALHGPSWAAPEEAPASDQAVPVQMLWVTCFFNHFSHSQYNRVFTLAFKCGWFFLTL